MTYHDNEVVIVVGGGYTLVSGQYTVKSFSVTPGQDPDGKIYVGLTNTFGSNGKMSFRVGRKGSSTVANWFNNAVPANRTTFNHSAGDLNFAFLGTLTLTLTGGILGAGRETFTFSNAAIAQGHSGASNNWWFGGDSCSYIGNDRVVCTGVNAHGTKVSFVFLRGGNPVNEIYSTPDVLVDTVAWMGNLPNTRTLNQLVMPGSHDAGMSELHHCNPFVGAGPYTQTQSQNILGQLNSGSRYFDIRVDYDYNELVTYHRTGATGCNGQSLKSVLDQAVAFLSAHKSETCILKFSHIRDYGSDHKPADTKAKINTLLNSYAGYMYVNPNAGVNLANVALGDVRGKMILVFDYNEYINPATGRFHYADGSAPAPGYNITVYDEYSDTDNFNTMQTDQLKKLNQYGGLGKGYFFLLSWTLTSNNPPFSPSIESLANTANSNLPGALYTQIVANKGPKPNIVYIDYVNGVTTQSIIQYNFI